MRARVMILGRGAVSILALVGRVFKLHAALAAKLRVLPSLNLGLLGRLTLNQIRFTGVQAVPLIAASATLIGGVSIMQTVTLLTGVADDLIGAILVGIIVREIGPLIAAAILIGRSGTAMATEIGSMRLSGEMDALKAYRIDPVDFVILPRVVGMVTAMFCLVICFDVLGVLGGFGMVLLLKDISVPQLLGRVGSALTNADLAVTVLKAVVFGQAVSVLSCHYGMSVRHSPTELPQAVTRAVVACMISVLALDSAITVAFYLL
ncbi:MAG: ABC transporter permease [Elusimicrobia bacterium]|nr:ABC transporter permease [Elusimicrobiota bacterium]